MGEIEELQKRVKILEDAIDKMEDHPLHTRGKRRRDAIGR